MIIPLAIAALGWAYLQARKQGNLSMPSKATSGPMDPKFAPMRLAIENAAKKHNVPLKYALAFAWLESRFNPRAKGDLKWHQWDDGARYKKFVLNNPTFANNPFRNTPEVWHSYGLFQLLAPHFLLGHENPAILFYPEINADRGVKKIANSLKTAKGDIGEARVIYAGASKLSQATKDELKRRLTEALALFKDI